MCPDRRAGKSNHCQVAPESRPSWHALMIYPRVELFRPRGKPNLRFGFQLAPFSDSALLSVSGLISVVYRCQLPAGVITESGFRAEWAFALDAKDKTRQSPPTRLFIQKLNDGLSLTGSAPRQDAKLIIITRTGNMRGAQLCSEYYHGVRCRLLDGHVERRTPTRATCPTWKA
ncbi:hypothetical protein N657DRAFT_133632 [Parathielavia appendiculata]|uniref:Uncharacterized protein n=1 Tax=Parathielavia appendiculata TaxID=2587402 RepID=A0AAN6Z106_9PEZI|nr:hypothetical protein N657DRAFT_133632 [Parathielavia appendiculata]